MGSSIELVNNFKVKEIIFNCGEYNKLEKERKNESKNVCYKNGN